MTARSVLLINRVLPPAPGASGRLLADLARHLAQAGWRVTVLVDQGPGQAGDGTAAEREAMPDIAVVVTGAAAGPDMAAPDGPGAYAAAGWRLLRAALRLPPHDLVITMTDPPLLALLASLLRRLRGGETLHWVQDLYPDLLPVLGRPLPEPLSRLAGRIMRAALADQGAVLCIGPCMADRLCRAGVPASRITVVPNWPQDALRSAQPDPIRLAALLGRRPPGLVALYAGTLGLAHPVEILGEAARRLARSHPQITLLVVGAGRQADRLVEVVARHRLDNLRLLAPLPEADIASLSASADLHIALMRDGAAGLMLPCKVGAALGAGRPVLFCGPAESGAARMLRDSGAGLVLPPTGGALAAALGRLADEPAALGQLQRQARAARQGWTRAEAVDRIGRLAAGVVGGVQPADSAALGMAGPA